ncbi:putative small-subunit processome, Utp21 protein [Rosa chinensis]|uniref:Putative small-subunit processome, Utp21 protein n=1 Tax=Rosa chinensis TaxID=74649 RepID=A0A2P6QS00_ROSCH|nr:putative small-subunit processome, Utp21 protein [Rosa chinensis]
MKNFSEFTDFIKTLAPSPLDTELRILQIVGDEDEEEPEKLLPIELLLDYFIHETACRNNFDFVQAVIRVFLKIDGETIRCQSRLQDKASKLLDVQCNTWQRVDKMFQCARCMVTFLSNSQF